MKITVKDSTNPGAVADALDLEFRRSRFSVAEIRVKGRVVSLHEIRLRVAKPYCGSHPASCEVRDFGGKPRMAKWLEGLDWVEVNDRINNVLDRLSCAANARSLVCVIRQGTERRTYYDMHPERGGYEWDMHPQAAHLADYCGKVAPASGYPVGTPGSYELAS